MTKFHIILSLLILLSPLRSFSAPQPLYTSWLEFSQSYSPDTCRSFAAALESFASRHRADGQVEQLQHLLAECEASGFSAESRAAFLCDINRAMAVIQTNELNAIVTTNREYKGFYELLAVVVIAAFAALIVFNNREIKKRDNRLFSSSALLHHTIQAQEDERSRLSRELHDGIAQDMHYIVLLAEKMKLSPTSEGLAEIQKKQTDCINEIRSTCYNLAPPAVQSGNMQAALSTLCASMEGKTSAELRLTITKDADFSPYDSEQALNIYRIVQELLNNAVKHSGASEITVLANKGKIIVTDDGKGIGAEILGSLKQGEKPAASYSHFGLRNILERVKLLGGSVRFNSSWETGTEVVVELPGRLKRQKKDRTNG